MKATVSLVVLFTLALVACGGGTSTAPGPSAPSLSVAFSSPNSDVFTQNSLVKIKLAVTGDPSSVELLKDGVLLSVLNAPYEYDFETVNSIEKTYALTARVKKAGFADVVSAVRQISVDRSAPTVTARVPIDAAPDVFLGNEISVTFNEAVSPASITAQSSQLRVGASVVSSVASLDASGKKLTLRPTALPSLPATLDVVLTGITDLAGNATGELKSNFVSNQWPLIGGKVVVNVENLIPPGSTGPKSLAVDANANPYVVWSDASGIQVKHWNGTAWSLVGAFEAYGWNASIALNPSGKPVVGFLSAGKAYVKRWNGTNWELLGDTANSGIATTGMVLDSKGDPFVILNGGGLLVKHWDGTAWTDVGTSLGSGQMDSPSITLNPAGTPIVAWIDGNLGSFKEVIQVKEWNGTDWIAVGGVLNTGNTNVNRISSVTIAQGAKGLLYLAYRGSLKGADYGKPVVYLKAFSVFGWAQVGPSYINRYDDEYPDVRFNLGPALVIDPEGNPALALASSVTTVDNKAAVRDARLLRWNWNDTPQVWKETSVSKLDPNDGYAFGSGVFAPSLAFDSKGDPLVMYPTGLASISYSLRIQRPNRIP